MNGFLKKNNNKVYPFNSSKNIEHKGFSLFDYLENLKKNILNLFNIQQSTVLGLGFNDYRIVTPNTYEDLNYTDLAYNRYTNSNEFDVVSSGIWIKSFYKKNLLINLSTNVRADSGQAGLRYFRVEQWRDGSMINSEFSAVDIAGNGRANITIPTFFKVTYNDIIKIKVYGRTNDTFLLTRVNFEILKNNDNNYYENF